MTTPDSPEALKGFFLARLNEVLARPVRRLRVGKADPPPPASRLVEIYPRGVFDVPLSGEKHIFCGDGKAVREYRLSPGDVLFSPRAVWKLPYWDSAHELFCLVFHEKYLRFTYVDYTGEKATGDRPYCSCFYHTVAPPPSEMTGILPILTRLGERADHSGAAEKLCEAIFLLARRQLLAGETASPVGKAHRSFLLVLQYLHENLPLPLTRKETAAHFHLSSAYLSRLFRQQSGRSFSEVLSDLRMEHAAFLLRSSSLLIDEITAQCGYRSTPYFTSAFKARFGVPPGCFRREAAEKEMNISPKSGKEE